MIERYSRPEMARVWSDDHRLKMMLRVEEAFLEVLAREKNIPEREMKAFKGLSQKLLLDKAREHEARCGHEVIGLLAAVAGQMQKTAPTLNRYLHYGLTSSDVLDTALALQAREACDLLIAGWEALADRLKSLARKHELTWMVGRTHGVHAEPVTFGVKAAGWHAEAQRGLERLRRARSLISYGKFSGAVGTFSQVGPEIEARALEALALKAEPVATQVVARDRHAEYLQVLALCATHVERIALEIRHLQRTEVLEVEEPFSEGQKGSSAMPHKRNPVLCENLCGLARLMRSYADASLENVALWHERDISHSSVERVTFPDAHILLDFMIHRITAVLDGLQIYPARMKENLERSLGLVFSQTVLLRLIDAGMGRLDAYELVQRNAMKTWKTREPFQTVLQADPAVAKRLSKKDLAACFDLAAYKANVREILRRGGVF